MLLHSLDFCSSKYALEQNGDLFDGAEIICVKEDGSMYKLIYNATTDKLGTSNSKHEYEFRDFEEFSGLFIECEELDEN